MGLVGGLFDFFHDAKVCKPVMKWRADIRAEALNPKSDEPNREEN